MTVLIVVLVLVALVPTFFAGSLFGQILERRAAAELIALKAQEKAQPMPFAALSRPEPGTAGWTIIAAMSGAGCLGRSKSDEPVFVLCARDKTAAMLVRDWAALLERLGGPAAKVADARALADRMERWREAHGGGKLPD